MQIPNFESSSDRLKDVFTVTGNDVIRAEISDLMHNSGIEEYIERERVLIVSTSDAKKLYIELELSEELAILPFIRFADMLGIYLAQLSGEVILINERQYHKLWSITEDTRQLNYRVRYQCQLPSPASQTKTSNTKFVPLSAREIFSS